MKRYTLAVLVRNHFGVLNRITSMFRRRQFNIRALTVSETETNLYSRITVIFEGEDDMAEQLINQLYKLPDVCAIKEMQAEDSISCELMLIKMRNTDTDRENILSVAKKYKAEIVDCTRDALIIRITDDSACLDNFVDAMREYTILEICRTGVVSLERSASTIREVAVK